MEYRANAFTVVSVTLSMISTGISRSCPMEERVSRTTYSRESLRISSTLSLLAGDVGIPERDSLAVRIKLFMVAVVEGIAFGPDAMDCGVLASLEPRGAMDDTSTVMCRVSLVSPLLRGADGLVRMGSDTGRDLTGLASD